MKDFLHVVNKVVFMIAGFFAGFMIYEKYNQNALMILFMIILAVIVFSLLSACFDYLIDRYL